MKGAGVAGRVGAAGGPRHLALWSGRLGGPHADGPDPGLPDVGTREVVAALDALRP
jgi:hypothetical protein